MNSYIERFYKVFYKTASSDSGWYYDLAMKIKRMYKKLPKLQYKKQHINNDAQRRSLYSAVWLYQLFRRELFIKRFILRNIINKTAHTKGTLYHLELIPDRNITLDITNSGIMGYLIIEKTEV